MSPGGVGEEQRQRAALRGERGNAVVIAGDDGEEGDRRAKSGERTDGEHGHEKSCRG